MFLPSVPRIHDAFVDPQQERSDSTGNALSQELFPGAKVVEKSSIFDIDWEGLKAHLDQSRLRVKSYSSKRNESGELVYKGSEDNYRENIPFVSGVIDESRVYKESLSEVSWPTYDLYRELFPIVQGINQEFSELIESDASALEYIALLRKVVLPLYETSYENDPLDFIGTSSEFLAVPTEIRQYLITNVTVPILEAIESLDVNEEDLDVILTELGEVANSTGKLEDIRKQVFSSQVTHTMIKIGGSKAVDNVMGVYESYYSQEHFYTPEKLKPDYMEAPTDYITSSSYDNYVYALHGALIKQLSMVEDDPFVAVQAMSRMLGLGSTGSLGFYVKSLERIGSEVGIPMLLGKLRSGNWLERRMSAEILFHLELGSVGVTSEGVDYLGKLYDLGKYNDPDFFVRRLNNSGLMGVLDEDTGGIQGVFPLDIYAEEKIVRAEVRQLVTQELFLPKADETPQQRQKREHYLKLFLANYESIFNDEFFEGTGVRLNSLDLHEQGWFLLTYLELSEQENTAELARLKTFVRNYGEAGLKSFLALDYGGSGAEILDFAETPDLSREEKLAIFRNFYTIASGAFNWRNIFSEVESGAGVEFAPQVHESFIRKNAEFFRAAQLIARGEGGEVSMNDLLKGMSSVAFALHALEGLYAPNSRLYLEQKPQVQDEYDADGNLVAAASSTFILFDDSLGARVVVSIRPSPTVRQGNRAGGEARINFGILNTRSGERVRVGFDLSDYGEVVSIKEKPSVVSLDLGIGRPDRESGIWPSQRVGYILEIVPDSEGGHNELSFTPEVAGQFPEIAEHFRSYVQEKFVATA